MAKKSQVNKAGNYTKPGLFFLAKMYKARGGGYR